MELAFPSRAANKCIVSHLFPIVCGADWGGDVEAAVLEAPEAIVALDGVSGDILEALHIAEFSSLWSATFAAGLAFLATRATNICALRKVLTCVLETPEAIVPLDEVRGDIIETIEAVFLGTVRGDLVG